MYNILVCDDDREIVDAIEIYLTQEGYHVLKAYDGMQAIQMLEREEIQLLIIDVMMPKLDGIRATLKIREKLEAMGIKVYLTRDDDSDVTLDERCKSANKKHCTLFVSIHRNSAEDKKANGIEAWVSRNSKGDEYTLAENLVNNICNLTGQQNRGIKKGFRDNSFGDYYINSDTDMPSLLLEVGFITNDKDNKIFDEKLDEAAEVIAKTIYDHIQK